MVLEVNIPTIFMPIRSQICQGSIHPRLEVRDLAMLKEQWALFNLSLQRVQQADYRPVAAKMLSIGSSFKL